MVTLSKKDVRRASKGKERAAVPLPEKGALKQPAPVQPPSDQEDDEDQDWTDDEELLDDDDEELLDDEEGAEDDSYDSDEDEENGGVSEKGLQRLMELVGEDDLDDFDKARLGLTGDEEENDDEDDGDDGEEDTVELEEEELEEGDEDEDEEDRDVDVDEEEIDLEQLGSDISMEDAVPVQKVITDNRPGMKLLREKIAVTSLPWREHLTLSSKESVTVDPSDDLRREMAFYKIALDQVAVARKLCSKYDIPFSRPVDYYAEMVKSDEHMERVRTKLVEEASSIKKSEAAKKQRNLKKFGKQIQQEKLKQREMDKKSFNEKMHGIKRKRKDGMELGDEDDEFGIAVDGAEESTGRDARGRGGPKGKMPRHARDAKYSLGGGGRHSKQNTKESANDIPGWGNPSKSKAGGKVAKGKPGGGRNRPGKARRKAGRA